MDLKEYVASARASGQSDFAIRQALSNSGWPDDKINEVLGSNTGSSGSSHKKLFIIIGVVVLIALLIFLLGGSKDDSADDKTSAGDTQSTSTKYRPGIPIDDFKFTSINVLFTDDEVKDVTPENVDLFFTGLNVDNLKQDWSLYENYYFSGKDEKRFGFSNSDANLNPYINPVKTSNREPKPELGHITYIDLSQEMELECVALNGCTKEKGYSMVNGFSEYKYEIDEKTTFKKTAFGKELKCFKNSDSYEKHSYIEFICVDDKGFDVINSRIEFDKTTSKAKGIFSYVALIYDIRPLNSEEKSFVTRPSKISISNNEYDSLDVEFAKKTIISETGALESNVVIKSLKPVV